MTILVAFINFSLIVGLTWYLTKAQREEWRGYFLATVTLRFVGGVALGCVYLFYYQDGDTFSYFTDATLVSDFITRDPALYWNFLTADEDVAVVLPGILNQAPRALFMVKLTSLVSFVSAHNYWVASLYFSLFSGLTAWYFFKILMRAFPGTQLPACLGVLFFPSVVFWGSGITKENVALGSLFILASVFLKVMVRTRVMWFEWLMAFVAFLLAWNLKYYWLAVFIPVGATSLAIERFLKAFLQSRATWVLWTTWFVSFGILIALVSTLRPNFNFDRLLHVIAENHAAYIKISSPEDAVHFSELKPNWSSMVLNSPLALVSALFRPSVFEIHTLFQGVSAVENLVIFIVTLIALFKIKDLFRSEYRVLLFSALVYTVVLSIFLALSTPNLGTLVRYRVGFLPFFAFVIFLRFPFPESMRKRFPNLAP